MLIGCSRKKAEETSRENWSRYSFDDFLEESVYFFSDGKTRLHVKLELEYNCIVPLVFIETVNKDEGEIRRYLQLICFATQQTILSLGEK